MITVVSEKLKSAGIDVDSALERFMGNEKLLTKFLNKFLDDTNYEKLVLSVNAEDKEGALAASHTLKGVCGESRRKRAVHAAKIFREYTAPIFIWKNLKCIY